MSRDYTTEEEFFPEPWSMKEGLWQLVARRAEDPSLPEEARERAREALRTRRPRSQAPGRE